MNGKVLSMKLTTKPQKQTRTTTDTIMFTQAEAAAWPLPPGEIQRALVVNAKVREMGKGIAADSGVIPGILTFAMLDKTMYLVNGQHRRAAFVISECPIGYADIQIVHLSSVAEMAKLFSDLQKTLKAMRPDDSLRAAQHFVPTIKQIREACPFVGFEYRRGGQHTGPILSMSIALRCWSGSAREVPMPRGQASTAQQVAEAMGADDTASLIGFLTCAFEGFGADAEYKRLWGGLNLMMTMWLYRRMVMTSHSAKTPRLTRALFSKCLMELSADSSYVDWLRNRTAGDRERAPAYRRIRAAFARRIQAETGKKPLMPAPSWAT